MRFAQVLKLVHCSYNVVRMISHDRLPSISRMRTYEDIGPPHRPRRLQVRHAIV